MKSTSLPYNDIVKTMEHKRKASSLIKLFFISAVILAAGSALADKKVYRWVDEHGEVHYSETLPPDFEDKKHDELDDHGIVRAEDQSLVPPPPKVKVEEPPGPNELPRDSSGMKRPDALYSKEELQRRMDRFLLLRYSSEQEIIEAMTVEINQFDYDRNMIEASNESLTAAFRGQIKEAAERQRAGVAIDPKIVQAISNFQTRRETNIESLSALQARQEEVKANFESELERYRHLIEISKEES